MFLKYWTLALTGNGLFRKSRRHPAICWVEPSLEPKKSTNQRRLKRMTLYLLVVIVELGAVVDHCHDVWIIMLVVIVERVKEDCETIPLVRASKNRAIMPLWVRVPKGLREETGFNWIESFVKFNIFILTSPSAPILPRPVTLKTISTSHQSNVVWSFDQMDPCLRIIQKLS